MQEARKTAQQRMSNGHPSIDGSGEPTPSERLSFLCLQTEQLSIVTYPLITRSHRNSQNPAQNLHPQKNTSPRFFPFAKDFSTPLGPYHLHSGTGASLVLISGPKHGATDGNVTSHEHKRGQNQKMRTALPVRRELVVSSHTVSFQTSTRTEMEILNARSEIRKSMIATLECVRAT
jgi:hypothetical protein